MCRNLKNDQTRAGNFSCAMERDHLLREKLSVLQNMIITDRVVSLGVWRRE